VRFYYEGFSSRRTDEKLAVRVSAGGNPPRCQQCILCSVSPFCFGREELAIYAR
jgi:hypothetical protein